MSFIIKLLGKVSFVGDCQTCIKNRHFGHYQMSFIRKRVGLESKIVESDYIFDRCWEGAH